MWRLSRSYSLSQARLFAIGRPIQSLMPVLTFVCGGFGRIAATHFFDTRVFYPNAPSYRSKSLPSLYRRFEGDKKREYGERVREIEHGSFTPLVFSSCGGMGSEAKVAIKKLAAALAAKRGEPYSGVMSWLCCCLSFILARSALRCVRGSRSICRRVAWVNNLMLAWFVPRPAWPRFSLCLT